MNHGYTGITEKGVKGKKGRTAWNGILTQEESLLSCLQKTEPPEPFFKRVGEALDEVASGFEPL